DAGTGNAPNADYTLNAGTLNFPACSTTTPGATDPCVYQTFQVTVHDNNTPQANRTVGVQLTEFGTQAATATLSIVDDDNPAASVQFSAASYSIGEGGDSGPAVMATITVTLSKPILTSASVAYTTSDPATGNPATAGVD